MPEIARLNGGIDWINLVFVKRERTLQQAMKLGIQMHIADLSLSDRASLLEMLGVQRSRKTIHDQVRKPIYSQTAAQVRLRLRGMKR